MQQKLLPGIWGIFYRGVPKLALARNPPGVCRGATPLCLESRGLKRDCTDYPPLRGHDEAWPSEVAERCSGTLPGVLGVDQATYGNRTIIPTGQWSDPVTSGMMKALVTDGTRFLLTKK